MEVLRIQTANHALAPTYTQAVCKEVLCIQTANDALASSYAQAVCKEVSGKHTLREDISKNIVSLHILLYNTIFYRDSFQSLWLRYVKAHIFEKIYKVYM